MKKKKVKKMIEKAKMEAVEMAFNGVCPYVLVGTRAGINLHHSLETKEKYIIAKESALKELAIVSGRDPSKVCVHGY